MKKNPIRLGMLAAGLCFSSFSVAATDLPNIKILATGGTIAGAGQSATESNYTAGKVGVDALIAAVPDMTKIADISGEQVVSIGSQDMNDEVWLKLAKRVNELLAQDDVDGIVITHGTDTMEETAYFLDLTVKSKKPVVLVGAMRPSTAMSADGPVNLYNAVVAATDEDSKGRGVLVTMNDTIFDARDVTKTNTTSVNTFQSPNFGPLGYIHNSDAKYQRSPERKHTTETVFDVSKLTSLPKVGIVYNYANASDLPVKALIDAKFDGIVSAGVGNGNLYHTVFDQLEKASKDGIMVVRSSRTPTGSTTLDAEIDDAKYGFVASGTLNPQKARILLMLSLTQTKDYKDVQKMFQYY
ncbi:L-asparaginase 2 [Photobacterium damselae subsp. piscicida]|uniref:asparaginase n=2 Tax=Photobacterium damselae TaxID=38293 RepID=A0A1V1VFE0_PHODP|nr:L-asparaginase 2 [Photobacterium damselae]MBE8126900.1 L-asparaginase 2 [Photobacterium damselae subsp. piscicida]MDP2533886.1 L-asparaginase 2 [Photobacterium damselae subsp. piscicida]MDP2556867.1 L-asparaginase 2 [Photobacterium damselae subsp. piscicida]PSV68349.1 L-asparaginase 2 [Photobacterium damselae]PSW76941.1 L-asparaginase 2 [Photobacterium damselae]